MCDQGLSLGDKVMDHFSSIFIFTCVSQVSLNQRKKHFENLRENHWKLKLPWLPHKALLYLILCR